jgi:hypothetical protein
LVLSLASSAFVGALIPNHVPKNHDEFAFLLAGQTFAHFRLTNPTHPLWRFFETQHVLMRPSYMAKFPPGQGLAIAVGYWLGHPIYGVWLECALFAAAVAWMLRGFFGRPWALLGGALAIGQLGATHYWAQTYWGGALAAAGGALVFGGARRIWRAPRPGDAALFGVGIVILILTRPFEGLLVALVPLGIVFARWWWARGPAARPSRCRLGLPLAAVLLAGGCFLGYYNYRVTGSALRLPYTEYEAQYSGMPLFVWQSPGPAPHTDNLALQRYYEGFIKAWSRWRDPLPVVFVQRLGTIIGQYWGVVLGALAVIGLMIRPNSWSWVATASLGCGLLATMLCFWFDVHYQAPAVALYLFLAVAGTRVIYLKLAAAGVRPMVMLTLFALAYGLPLAYAQTAESRLPVYRASSNRRAVLTAAQARGGRHLVFVRLIPPIFVHEPWVYNDADIDQSPVVWAWDRGADENRKLLAYFPDRIAVLMTEHYPHVEFIRYPLPPAPAAASP